MGRRKFQDRPPGTAAHEHAVGGGSRIKQPKRSPVTIKRADGTEEVVSASSFDKARKQHREARKLAESAFDTLLHEPPEGVSRRVRDMVFWARLESGVDPEVYRRARLIYDEIRVRFETKP